MTLSFQCPYCACAYDLNDALGGSTLLCRQCGQQIQAPGIHPSASREIATDVPGTHIHGGKKDMPLLNPAPTRFCNQITRHIERTIGRSPMVFHEIISSDVRLDLHVVPPAPACRRGFCSNAHPFGRNCFTVVTSGMSTRPLPLPAGADSDTPRLVELLVSLPADWRGLRQDGTIVDEYMHHEENWWPLRWLKTIARMPHENNEWIGAGQIIHNIPADQPFANDTRFTGILLLPSVIHPQAQHLVVHDDTSIEFLALWPLYAEEIELCQLHGLASLKAAFANAGVTDRLDIHRPNVATADADPEI